MIDFFLKGGVLMYPILACSIISLAIIAERIIFCIVRRDRRAVLRRVKLMIQQSDIVGAEGVLQGERGIVAEFISLFLENRNRAGLESLLENKGDELLAALGRGIHLLGLIERLAPLLGFLGTVAGMVSAFARVASFEGPVKPSLIADGIWQALITTAAGLVVAIPALIGSHFFLFHQRAKAADLRSYGELLLEKSERNTNAHVPQV